MGLMNMTTAKTSEKDLANYSAATLYQNLWSRSRIKAIFLNKQNIGNNSNDNYGRNTAAEFTYIKKDGSIILKLQLISLLLEPTIIQTWDMYYV